MGTRSDIIVHRADGVWARIYCHWDGYPGHNGRILQEHYNSQELAEKLIAPGDMSSLDEKCSKPDGHSFDTRVNGYTVYYGRDRGETGIEPKEEPTLLLAWPVDTGSEYTYVWKEGRWWVAYRGTGIEGLRFLSHVLNSLATESAA